MVDGIRVLVLVWAASTLALPASAASQPPGTATAGQPAASSAEHKLDRQFQRAIGRIVQHIHIHIEPRFQIRDTEQRLHQQISIHSSGAWHQNDPDIFRAFVPDILQKRDFTRLDQIGNPLNQF